MKTGDGRPETEDGRPEMEDRRWKTEDGRPKTDDRRWKTEDGRPKTADGRPETEDAMTYKFEKLEIHQLALDHLDLIYALADRLPASEQYNLRSQIIRAATSVVLNIAEGSTSQSDAEQVRFLGMGLRSLIETVACRQIIARRKFIPLSEMQPAAECAEKLFVKIQAMRNALERRKSATA